MSTDPEKLPTIDVVAVYYDQLDKIPYFCRGIELNADDLNGVIVVKDGVPTEEEQLAFAKHMPAGVRWVYLGLGDKPEGSFRVGSAINRGAAASSADFIQGCAVDVILAPGMIGTLRRYAHRRVAIVSACHRIAADTPLHKIPERVEIVQPDWKPHFHPMLERIHRSWQVHHGLTLWHREDFLNIGGYNTTTELEGRTQEDHELGAHWAREYGTRSILMGPGEAWHLGTRENDTDAERRPTEASRRVLAQTLGWLYDQRYYLFADPRQPIWSHVQCLPNELLGVRCDVRVDCQALNWMPEGEVRDIVLIAGHRYLTQPELLAAGIARALRPWGQATVFFPENCEGPDCDAWAVLLEEQGLEVEKKQARVLSATKACDEDEETTQ